VIVNIDIFVEFLYEKSGGALPIHFDKKTYPNSTIWDHVFRENWNAENCPQPVA
jgi:hypothetical protein